MKKFILLFTLLFLVINMNGQEYTQHFVNGMHAMESKDYDTAIQEFTAGANLNDKFCCGRLGIMYLYGVGIPSNIPLGRKWLTKGYKLGNSFSAATLGMSYISENYTSSNWNRARPILEFAYLADDAEKDNEVMYANLGCSLVWGYWINDNHMKGIEWINRVLQDYPNSPISNGQFSLLFYMEIKDFDKAVKCATIGDKGGNLMGTYILGLCLAYGKGIQKNEIAGFKKIRKVAYLETMDDAMFELANMYYNGIGTPVDKAEAKIWYEKAAALGHPSAQEELELKY